MTPRNIPLLGSGYRPTIWCVNPSCHAPIPAGSIDCPECGEPITRPDRQEPRSAEIDVETLLKEGRY